MVGNKQDTGSLFGNGSEFSGKLSFTGTVRVEGKIEGEIYSDDTLVVADGGYIRGMIRVGTLIVTGGLVEAEIIARNAVEIHPGGRVIGEVTSPIFQIERGAFFQGQSRMPEDLTDDIESV